MKQLIFGVALSAIITGAGFGMGAAQAEGTFSQKSLTPEVAVKLAQSTLDACRKQGFQVAVAVVDRGGNLQALIRDRFAGPHTPITAERKAYTALSFKANTTDLAERTQPGQPSSGTRAIPNILMLGGGMMIETGGSLIGGVGVSGAPSGDADQACATAGLNAIIDDLGF